MLLTPKSTSCHGIILTLPILEVNDMPVTGTKAFPTVPSSHKEEVIETPETPTI